MKKHHFDAFRNEKHFEKQPQPHSQTGHNRSVVQHLQILKDHLSLSLSLSLSPPPIFLSLIA